MSKYDIGRAIINRQTIPGHVEDNSVDRIFVVDLTEVSIGSEVAFSELGEACMRHVCFLDRSWFPERVAWKINDQNPRGEDESLVGYIRRLAKETTKEVLQGAVRAAAIAQREEIIERTCFNQQSGFYRPGKSPSFFTKPETLDSAPSSSQPAPTSSRMEKR